jgi:ATP-binding cassette subfamily F protein uup
LQRELDGLPADIERLETEIAAFEEAMGDPAFYQQDEKRVAATIEALNERQAELETAMDRWIALEAMASGET